MHRLATLPPWLDRHFRVFEDSRRVADILVTLAAGEREGRTVLLPRRGEPQVLPDDGTGFAVLLETSGTTGAAKRVRHDPLRLFGRLRGAKDPDSRWLLTYDPASFAGLQVILTAAQTGATLYAAPGADVSTFARMASERRVTHISGTPSFWRGFLMACPPPWPPLAAITLGGEAADQKLLDALSLHFPDARLRHIYASTEAGALFAVTDGREGFPAAWLDDGVEGVRLEIRDGVLWVNSPRAMLRYERRGEAGTVTADTDGWLDTGDLVAVAGDRVVFRGRADGRVNVGGVKVSPEEAEGIILAVDGVADAQVSPTPSPVTGHILTATIVPAVNADTENLRKAVLFALADLPPAARPRVISFADSLPLSKSGKKNRGMA